MSLIDVTIAEIIQESPSVKSFRLVRSDGEPLGKYLPGAHIDVTAPNAITRQYSLCSAPEAGDMFTVAVKREDDSRGGSAALHELEVGDRLRISPPRNLLGIAEGASHHVLIAAGIGITPLLSMARYMDVHDIGFELHYFARSAEEAAFLPLLQDRCPEKLHTHLGIPRADQDSILEATLAGAPEGSHAYVCGPVGFMQKVVDLADGHLPPEAVHREDFHAAPLPDASENTVFEVELEDEVYEVGAGQSIVEVLKANGCDVDTSCEEGVCGTCVMQVLSGDPEHRDSVLTREEKAAGELIATCVSRAVGPRLVLDYY